MKIFYVVEEEDLAGETARAYLQSRAEEKNIAVGNVIKMEDTAQLFKFADENAKCLFYHPPLECKPIIYFLTIHKKFIRDSNYC